jgi:hypothetical protein
MARPKSKGESLSGWFRQYWRDHPDAVRSKSNDEVVGAWKSAHPGRNFSDRERQAMANTKSSVKKELGIRGRRRRRRKAGAVAEAPGKGPRGPRANAAGSTLEQLEVAIDRCLSAARGHEDRDEEMHKVVRHLRFARNELVWILGKKPQRTSAG